jgi:hypothetical protein
MFENWFTIIIAAAIAGIGSGIGVAIGQALYKALMEDKINRFLDKKHREEALKKLTNIDSSKSIFFSRGTQSTIPEDTKESIVPPPKIYKPINSETIVNKMLGRE